MKPLIFQAEKPYLSFPNSCTCHSSKGFTRLKGDTSRKIQLTDPPLESRDLQTSHPFKSDQKLHETHFHEPINLQCVCARWFDSWLVHPLILRSLSHLKGHKGHLTIPKRSRIESPGAWNSTLAYQNSMLKKTVKATDRSGQVSYLQMGWKYSSP